MRFSTWNTDNLSWLVLGALLLSLSVPAQGQQVKKIPRVGFLSPGNSPQNDFRYEAFQLGLRELGYVDGRSIIVEYHGADGNTDRFNELAAELVHRKVDVIVTATQKDYEGAAPALKLQLQSLEVRGPAIYPYNRQPSLSSSSTSRPRNKSV